MPNPIRIKRIIVRECRTRATRRGVYTDESKDPENTVWLLVSISDGQAMGYGECIPTSIYYEPGHIGRANIDEWKVLLELCRELLGQDARRLGNLIPEDQEHDDANSIKDTLDFALHDLVGRSLGVPVGVLLGGQNRSSVAGMPVIHVDTPQGMAEHAFEQHRRYGFKYFKLKPIGEPEADVETLALMREKMGSSVRYYMDANYALKVKDPDEVARYLNRLAPYGLEVYEDPLDADFAIYRYIRERTKVKLMIDEKARTPRAIMDIIRERCADQINIHANWSGGFRPALRKAELAALGGMATMIGSTSYMGPGAAAYQILSMQLPLETPCEQTFCDGDVDAQASIIKESFPCRDGRYYIPDRPGLGVEVIPEAVERLTTRKVELG